MRRVQLSFAIILTWVGLLGASSCALYEEFEPLGSRPDGADVQSDGGADAGSDAEVDSGADADSDSDIDIEEPGGVVVSVGSLRLELFETHQLSAVLNDADGEEISEAEFTWQSDDESIAIVDETGLVEGLALGATTLVVRSGEASATVGVVVYTQIERVQVEPSSLVLNLGEDAQLSATLYDEDDAILGGYEIAWSSSDTSIATVDSDGAITGMSEGVANIVAESQGVSGAAQVRVQKPTDRVEVVPGSATLEVMETLQLTAIVYDIDDDERDDPTVEWTSSKPAIVSVTSAGLIQGLKEGSATIRAESGGKQTEVQITVTAPVKAVQISPRRATVGVASDIQMSATLLDAAGNELSGRSVTWASSGTDIATINAQGVAFGVFGGTVTITATSEGISDSTQLTVANPIATIVVSPDPVSVPVLGTAQLSAVPRDAGGNELSGRLITWRTDDASIATVDADGEVTGKSGGIVDITATAEGITASAQVTVVNVVTAVDISPASVTLEVTDTMQLTALAKNIRGNIIPGRSATWTTSNPSIVQVDASTGLITAMRSGTATLSAQIDNITGTAQVTVEAPLYAVLVTPQTANVEVTKTVDLSVTLKDKAGNTIAGGGSVSWSSENTSIATVDSNGRVTAVSKGVVTLSAEVDGITGEAAITVETLPRSMSVSPTSVSFNISETRTLTAEVLDLNDEPVSGVTVQWSVDDSNVATVSSTGAMTAKLIGHGGGSTTVRASVDNGRGGVVKSSVSVSTSAVVSSVEVLPNSVALFPGDQAQLDAVLRDANHDELSGISVTWSTGDPSIAKVNASGLVTAMAFGTTQITASAEGQSASSTVEVVRWEQIVAHHHNSCGVVSNGDAYCWGRNNHAGILGNGSVDSGSDSNNLVGDADAISPTLVSGGINFASITLGMSHACGLTPTGKAYCWGHGGAGHLGQGNNSSSPTPVAVSGSYQFIDIQIGMNHTCGLDASDEVYCWGWNEDGQLGQGAGSATSYSTPRRVLGHKFISLAGGSNHTCAVSEDGPTYCWGKGPLGQLGDGNGGNSHALVQVDTPEEFVAVSAGYDFTCGINAAGEVYCWGENLYAVLGDGTEVHRHSPVRAAASQTFETLFAGGVATCARDSSQDVYCWGFNGQGNLGTGSTSASEPTPVLVSGGYKWRGFSVGLQHTCGLAEGNPGAFCWGDNDDGQIGNGLVEPYQSIPTSVANP